MVSIQNVAEFWNTATRPESKNGLGLPIEEVREEMSKLEGFFEVLHETEASYAAWKSVVIRNRVTGVQVHDARLVAVMKTAGIRQIVTFNIGDFKRYEGIEAIHPDAIL